MEPAPDAVTGDWVVEYQVNAPGKYRARKDPQFEQDWIALPCVKTDAGKVGATIPGEVQKNRNLVRYRIRSARAGGVVLPPVSDAQSNYAYFVYDGVPAWQGAINPKATDAKTRTRMTVPADAMSRVPVYHLIASQAAVENATWKDSRLAWNENSRSEYRYTRTMVYDGVVYDHVAFRARGGSWRHAMGKNMWKFNFNSGHRLAARDNYGQPYAAKWDKLNLGACIQQGDYGMRGEHGMFDALSYRLFNLAGVEAPRTHWIQLRIVSGAEETPADQYSGDFWGLYLATEEIDSGFLKEHQLPDGNVYKIDGYSPSAKHLAPGADTNLADARAFLQDIQTHPGGLAPLGQDNWWRAHVDLPRYYNYRAVLEAVHHYDLDAGKNYFFFNNLTAKRWQVIPWDVDLTWGEQMYGGGNEPFFQPVLQSSRALRREYQERLAELVDLLLNPEQMNRLIDEYSAQIWQGSGRVSLADADRAKWDYNPVMSSKYVMRGKSDPGRYYLGDPNNRFDVMITGMKQFASQRQNHLKRLLAGYQPPSAPKVAEMKSVRLADGPIRITAIPSGSVTKYRWRLADVTGPGSSSFDARKPWPYEIQPVWESGLDVRPEVEMPVKTLKTGHTYRLRVRSQRADEVWSRWSAPTEFVVQ